MEHQQTSREAWKEFVPESAELDRAILRSLCASPKTCQAIEDDTLRNHQAVSANLRHLVERGIVEQVPGEFGATRAGRKAMLWRVVTDPSRYHDKPPSKKTDLRTRILDTVSNVVEERIAVLDRRVDQLTAEGNALRARMLAVSIEHQRATRTALTEELKRVLA